MASLPNIIELAFDGMVAGWGTQPRGPAAQVDDRASPLSRYLDTAFPDLGVMHGPFAQAVDGAVTVRPPGLGPSPMAARADWSDVERAINYRLRLALSADVGLAPAHGIAALTRIQTPWPVLADGAFQHARRGLAGLHRDRGSDRTSPWVSPTAPRLAAARRRLAGRPCSVPELDSGA
jgi:hypothetical protein